MTATLDEQRAPAAEAKRSRRKLVLVGCVIAASVLFAAFGYEARVVFAVPTQEMAATAAVPVATELEPQKASVEETTGTTGGVGEQRATGRVVILYTDRTTASGCNERGDCPPAEIVVRAGTRLGTCLFRLSGDPTVPCPEPDVLFATQAPLRLQYGTYAEVQVQAVEPGTRGNVNLGAIRHVVDPPNIPHAALRIESSTVTTGGTDAATGIVAQADVDRVVKARETELRAAAERHLRAHAKKQGLTAAVTAVDMDVTAEPPVGASATDVRVTVAAVAKGVGYDADRLQAASERSLAAALAPGQFLVPDSVTLVGRTVRGSEVVAEARARSSAVDSATVKRQVARRWTASARHELKDRYGEGSVTIVRRPLPLPLLPFFASRVHVEVRQSSP